MPELWFENDGIPLFAVEEGSGVPLVMLHGGMASHVAALPLVAPLFPEARVILPDLRGSGRSRSAAALRFEQLASDVEALLDHLGIERAVVGGVSSGSGLALRFALDHPERTLAVVVVRPVYAGEERGYSAQQREIFRGMDAVASRAVEEGVQVLERLYAGLPSPMRERALAMVAEFDPASVVATSRFLVSEAQPFCSASELAALSAPTLLVRGDDPMHPREVSDLHAEHLPDCTVVPADVQDVAGAIGEFLVRVAGGASRP